jgi:putative phosphoesterase
MDLSPDGVPPSPERVVARLGLISDTHMPERCPALPPAVFTALAGVDLVLHSGDVGELWVLDELSRIAPVVAVHGNDDTAEAQRELPYQQILTVAGERILLWHSHFADPQEERASRRNDFGPGLERIAGRALGAGASIAVFGHWHLPLVTRHAGVFVVNPGAIASPNPVTRQAIQTVAILTMGEDGAAGVEYRHLERPAEPFFPRLDWSGGFGANLTTFSPSILAAELLAHFPALIEAAGDAARPFWEATLRVARRCWAGEQPAISAAALLAAAQSGSGVPRRVIDRLAQLAGD